VVSILYQFSGSSYRGGFCQNDDPNVKVDVGDTAVFSMNPKEVFTLGCCGNPTGMQSHTAVRTTHSPGTDSTAHSLPSAVIDK
jgi:hypothetical protein